MAATLNDISELFGESLQLPNGGGERTTSEALSGIDAVGIYFSAHWCPPCRGFTPVLAERYKCLKEAGKKIEIVFVSSDRDEGAFQEYHAEMPWLALPFAERSRKQTLSEKYGVRGIPTLVFVDANGELITAKGRDAVSSESYVKDFPYHPKPVNDLEDANGLEGRPLVLFMESSAAEEKKRFSEYLKAVAEAEIAKPASERVATSFFTGLVAGGLASKVRSLCGLPDIKSGDADAAASPPSMVLLILDGDGQPEFVAAGQEHLPPTQENINGFLATYKDGKIKAQPFITGGKE